MKPVIILVCIFLAPGLTNFSYGQKKSNKHLITGYVTDANHYPVVGAYIMVDSENSGVITDERGFYKVRVTPTAITVCIYSFTHGIIEENINHRTRINFTFSNSNPGKKIPESRTEDPEDKEEVNIGYSTVNRRNLSSSVSTIDGTEKRFASYNSIYDMLKGSVPGVQVRGDQILIRGFTSYRGSSEPLFIVDGTPVTSIADIPPQMVKSISVLKGSAGAIYGSRGANGVILIDLHDGTMETDETSVAPEKFPFVTTKSAANVQAKSATLNGIVNANDPYAFVVFEYGTSPGYGTKIPAAQSPVTGYGPSVVSAVVTDLQADITYHYRVIATNSQGSTLGNDIPFTTLGEVPDVETILATNTAPGSAQLNGFVYAGHLSTDATFEYGTDTNYGKNIPAIQSPLTGNSKIKVSAEVRDLEAGTTYHFRIVGVNEKGTVYGDDATFEAEYKIGEQINGGYIFYIDETGKHGLVCALTDQSQVALWGNCSPPGATGRTIGTGNQNTKDIVNGCSDEGTAAGLCNDLEMNGYNDWFLPSINELYLMYENLHEKGLGGFKDSYYWSSTQDKYGAWVVSFFYGSKSNHSRNENSILTRAVRAF